MTAIPIYFELPANLTVKKFINKLGKQANLQIVTQQDTIKTFYDSFDWRLYRANIICEFNHSKITSQLALTNMNSGYTLAKQEMQHVPCFSHLLTNGKVKNIVSPELDMRALLPLCHLPYQAYQINVLNTDQKTVLRIQINEYEFLNNRIQLMPLKGYEKAHQKIANVLKNKLEIPPASCLVLDEALKQQGRKPKDYSSKLAIQLTPKMRTDKACQLIYKHLLQAIQINEAGTIADTDSEFLHDFRVAVRRTRAGLSQIKNILPADVTAKYVAFFAWLGQITGPTRDLDVYLLSYPQYQEALPLTLRNDLAPLHDFLIQKQKHAQKELTSKLQSSQYNNNLLAWEAFLNEALPKKDKATGSHTNQSIKQLADIRIWKVYQRVLKEGRQINDNSPAESLHDLRKTCKKLRYLMEFFQSLYPQDEIKNAIKALKGFQSVLGDFQDYEIQETSIKQFSTEMMSNQVPSSTLLAMGVLVQYLDTMRCNARTHFTEQFTLFVQTENKTMFKKLFATKA